MATAVRDFLSFPVAELDKYWQKLYNIIVNSTLRRMIYMSYRSTGNARVENLRKEIREIVKDVRNERSEEIGSDWFILLMTLIIPPIFIAALPVVIIRRIIISLRYKKILNERLHGLYRWGNSEDEATIALAAEKIHLK